MLEPSCARGKFAASWNPSHLGSATLRERLYVASGLDGLLMLRARGFKNWSKLVAWYEVCSQPRRTV